MMTVAFAVIAFALFGVCVSGSTFGLTSNYLRLCLGLALLASTLGEFWIRVVIPMYAVLMLVGLLLYRSAELNKEAMNEEEESQSSD
jgi:hypothetical protein